ncbi:energy transducer TonB [Parapedobacter sp. 10938]|uniref:energy transducer TonB n=1 Tax=Parapedobacter flavus TaxID=3110225 RepID=UPI002DBB7E67|nr:energy transducer TonB [Parapedobacter sp. 10938]MEC3879412.1 energy transducer TonB [Parapedobacter sp. 10938]
MNYPKQDIFGQIWLDIIFEGRNKRYGAYVLRRDASKSAAVALFIASTAFVVLLWAPLIHQQRSPGTSAYVKPLEKTTVIELTPPPPIDKSLPEPPAAERPLPRTSQVRMPPPVVVSANRVTEDPPSTETLKLANPGPETITGDPGADIHIDIPAGHADGDAMITETAGTGNDPFVSVEIEPAFPGGIEAFLNYVQKNYRYPARAVESGVKGKIILSFIVERDGSLTDIRIVRDLKFGTGDEAVRLLKASPRWTPGVQNGREVRVAYTLPIALDLSQ